MPEPDRPRLIEVAFPLKQASLDSVHEKHVRHGHISTLHIWPARRPLAACRAALIATLLPDPGTPEKRKELLEKIGGKVVTEVQKKKVGGKTVETVKEHTEGGVLHWGNENSPDRDRCRAEIKKANEPGRIMEVAEFLRAVRRLVVDFVVGRVLTGEGGDETTASGLDDVTTYYILHRHDFGLGDAPVGACILYSVSCNLSDTELANRHEILLRTGGLAAAAAEDDGDADDESEEADPDAEPEEGTGSTVKLRSWNHRKRKSIGYDEEGRPAPLIDQVHRLMLLWKLGDVAKVDDYLDARGLRKNALFLQLLQALIELAGDGTDERVILENLSNHLAARGVAPMRTRTFFEDSVQDAE